MKITFDLTDAAVLRELGSRLERRRIDANLKQADLAEQAGVSKRTVERIEAGQSTDFRLLLRILRTLKLFDGLDGLVLDLPQSPMTLLKKQGRQRKRVGHSPRGTTSKSAQPTARPWKWAE